MSYEYDLYLINHKTYVKVGFDWLKKNIPEVLVGPKDKWFDDAPFDYEWLLGRAHDASKSEADEYAAYDAYFYGGNRSAKVVKDFNLAWLNHIHKNKHHWQHWVLIGDDPVDDIKTLDMPDEYIIEMICDWWAFSWQSGNLREIFKWYEDHSAYMRLSTNTRAKVESVLYLIDSKLEEEQK